MNTVILAGNIARIDERSVGDKTIIQVSVAVSDGYGDNKKTHFLPVTFFGKTADTILQYEKVGNPITIEGRIQQNNYEKKDGEKVYGLRIIGDRFEFVNGGKGKKEKQEEAPAGLEEFDEIEDLQLPF